MKKLSCVIFAFLTMTIFSACAFIPHIRLEEPDTTPDPAATAEIIIVGEPEGTEFTESSEDIECAEEYAEEYAAINESPANGEISRNANTPESSAFPVNTQNQENNNLSQYFSAPATVSIIGVWEAIRTYNDDGNSDMSGFLYQFTEDGCWMFADSSGKVLCTYSYSLNGNSLISAETVFSISWDGDYLLLTSSSAPHDVIALARSSKVLK